MTLFVIKLLAIWFVVSVSLGLLIGPALKRAGRQDSIEFPPLPSGSIDRDGLPQ
jgi:hypothetical protein